MPCEKYRLGTQNHALREVVLASAIRCLITGSAAGQKFSGLRFGPHPALSLGVTGAFLNALGILIGGLLGLALLQPLSLRTQVFFRSALGTATVFFGLQLVWLDVGGTFPAVGKQLGLAVLAVTLGFWIGKLLRLQKISNRLGRYAGSLIAAAQAGAPRIISGGLAACTILFCAAPLGLLGAVTDGLPAGDSQRGFFGCSPSRP